LRKKRKAAKGKKYRWRWDGWGRGFQPWRGGRLLLMKEGEGNNGSPHTLCGEKGGGRGRSSPKLEAGVGQLVLLPHRVNKKGGIHLSEGKGMGGGVRSLFHEGDMPGSGGGRKISSSHLEKLLAVVVFVMAAAKETGRERGERT